MPRHPAAQVRRGGHDQDLFAPTWPQATAQLFSQGLPQHLQQLIFVPKLSHVALSRTSELNYTEFIQMCLFSRMFLSAVQRQTSESELRLHFPSCFASRH